MKKYLLLFLFSVICIMHSCSDNNENIMNKAPIPVQQIGKGNLIGNYVPQNNMIITTSAQWNTLLTTLGSVGGMTQTNVDFNQDMVIAVFDQVYTNGGHSIDIIAVDENQQNIVVDVEKLLSGDVTTVVTQPFHIVKIPKSIKPVVFQ